MLCKEPFDLIVAPVIARVIEGVGGKVDHLGRRDVGRGEGRVGIDKGGVGRDEGGVRER